MNIRVRCAVVPRAAGVFFQNTAADILTGKDRAGIDEAAGERRTFLNEPVHRFETGGASINRKHPHRCLTEQLAIGFGQ